MNPQVLSNDLTILFGILASLLAVAGVLVAAYQSRQHFRIGVFRSHGHELVDLERRKIAISITSTLH